MSIRVYRNKKHTQRKHTRKILHIEHITPFVNSSLLHLSSSLNVSESHTASSAAARARRPRARAPRARAPSSSTPSTPSWAMWAGGIMSVDDVNRMHLMHAPMQLARYTVMSQNFRAHSLLYWPVARVCGTRGLYFVPFNRSMRRSLAICSKKMIVRGPPCRPGSGARLKTQQ